MSEFKVGQKIICARGECEITAIGRDLCLVLDSSGVEGYCHISRIKSLPDEKQCTQ